MTGTQQRVTRFALASLVTTTLLAVAVFPSISAGSAMSPEITDAAGDVSPAVVASNETIDNATVTALYQNATAYDVVKAWVSLETDSDFWIFIEVRDLPDGWGAVGDPPEESPFGSNLTHAGTSLIANFSIAGATYQAAAKLAMPGAGKLFDNYTLWHDGARGDVSGAYNTTEDWVAMKLPKAAFPGLVDGSRMTNFWVQGRFANRSMDYAPNARDSFGGTPDPLVLLGNIENGSLVMPNYGLEYTFGQYYHPPGTGGSGNWPTVPNIQLAAVGDHEKIVDAGKSVEYEMTIKNRATAEDTVYFVVTSAKTGWSNQLSATQFTLGPGESEVLQLKVSASESTEGLLDSLVGATSRLGGEDELTFTTIVNPKEDAPISQQPGSGDDPKPVTTEPKGGSPGFAVAAVVGAIGIALFLARRRK